MVPGTIEIDLSLDLSKEAVEEAIIAQIQSHLNNGYAKCSSSSTTGKIAKKLPIVLTIKDHGAKESSNSNGSNVLAKLSDQFHQWPSIFQKLVKKAGIDERDFFISKIVLKNASTRTFADFNNFISNFGVCGILFGRTTEIDICGLEARQLHALARKNTSNLRISSSVEQSSMDESADAGLKIPKQEKLPDEILTKKDMPVEQEAKSQASKKTNMDVTTHLYWVKYEDKEGGFWIYYAADISSIRKRFKKHYPEEKRINKEKGTCLGICQEDITDHDNTASPKKNSKKALFGLIVQFSKNKPYRQALDDSELALLMNDFEDLVGKEKLVGLKEEKCFNKLFPHHLQSALKAYGKVNPNSKRKFLVPKELPKELPVTGKRCSQRNKDRTREQLERSKKGGVTHKRKQPQAEEGPRKKFKKMEPSVKQAPADSASTSPQFFAAKQHLNDSVVPETPAGVVSKQQNIDSTNEENVSAQQDMQTATDPSPIQAIKDGRDLMLPLDEDETADSTNVRQEAQQELPGAQLVNPASSRYTWFDHETAAARNNSIVTDEPITAPHLPFPGLP